MLWKLLVIHSSVEVPAIHKWVRASRVNVHQLFCLLVTERNGDLSKSENPIVSIAVINMQ